jgi:CheY-like chemotaxis protein
MRSDAMAILLAEDNDGHASLIRRNLERAGVINSIIHVHDGQEALDFLRCEGIYAGREKPSSLLILLDINMPRVDGVEVLREVKSNPATAMTPVIMLTTTDDPREVQRCYELGCSVYLTKPVQYPDFVEAIKRLGMFLEIIKAPVPGTAKENKA